MEKSTVSSGNWKRRTLAILLALTMVTQQAGFTFAGEPDPAAAAAAADTQAQAEAEAKAQAEAEAQAQAEAEARAKAEAEAQAKAEAEAKAKAEAEAQAKAESEARAKAESEAKAKAESEAKAKEESEAKARAESEAKAKEESEKAAKAAENAVKDTRTGQTEPSSEASSTEMKETPSETIPQTEAASEEQTETTDTHDADNEKTAESETKESETEEEFKTEFEYSDSSVIVRAVTTEGAGFPKDTVLHVDYLAPGTSAYEAALASVENALGISDEDGRNLYGVIYDVYFIVKGSRVDPDDTVRITMSFPSPVVDDIPEDEDIVDSVVMHVNDDGSANNVKEYVNAAADGSISQVGFNSDDFSPILVGAVTKDKGEDKGEETILSSAGVESSSSLNDFLTNVNIEGIGSDGKAKADTPYSISFSFSENADKQFANSGSLTYTVPEGLSLTPGTHGSFSIKGKDSQGNYEVTNNTYTVDSSGNIIVNWATGDSNWSRVAAGADCQFSINISGSFTKDTQFTNGNGDVIRSVTFDDTASVNPSKSAVYDPVTNKITYTIKAKADGLNRNVHFKDEVKGTAITLDPNSFAIFSSTGRNLPVPTASGNGFEYTVDSMSHNEEIAITYTASVILSKLDTSNANGGVINVDAGATGNEVRITSDKQSDGKTAVSQVNQIQYSNVMKSGSKGEIGSDGKQTVNWSITANENANFPMNGQSITDTIDANSQSIMKYSGTGITVARYTKEGSLAGSETISWDQLAEHSDASWKFKPTDTTPYKYVITYTTEVDTTKLYADTTVSNKVEGGGGSSTNGNVSGIQPGEGRSMGVAKEATEVSYSEVKWTSTITVPKQGLPKGTIFTDYLPTANGFTDALKGESVSVFGEGLSETDYSIDTSDSSKVVIRFPNGIRGNNESEQLVKVVLTTTNNVQWLEAAKTNGWLKEHENHVRLEVGTQHVDARAKALPVEQHIEKTSKRADSDVNGRPVFEFDIQFSGVTDGSFSNDELVLHDQFMTSLFDYFENDWIKTTLYQGDQYYQGTEISGAVTAESTSNGVDFKLSKDKLKSSTGEYYSYFRLHYCLAVKEGQLDFLNKEAVKADGGKLTYINKVNSSVGNKDCNFTYEVNLLSKDKIGTTTLEDGNKLVEFRIIANKDASQMNGGNPLTLTDTYTNLSVDYTTIRATDANGNEIDGVTWDYSGYTGTFTIPDSTQVIITYKARVIGSGQVNYSNTATLKGQSKTASGSENISTSGTGTVSNHSIRILKHEAGITSKGLSGAKFYLLDSSKQNIVDKSRQPVSVVTDENGIATVEGDMEKMGWALHMNTQYYLKEYEAPEGYELKTTYYGFKIANSADYDNYIYFDNDVLKISNKKTPCTATIEGVKTISGREFQNGDEFRFNISISSSGATDASGNQIETSAIPLPRGSNNTDATSVVITPSEGKNYNFSFEKITFTEPGTYHYTVTEEAVDKNGVKSDPNEVDVTVVVTNEEGKLSAAVSYKKNSTPVNKAAFENTYTTKGKAHFCGTKTLEGGDLSADQFEFEVTAEEETPLPDPTKVKNNANGAFIFNDIEYTKPGTYTYTVKEVLPEGVSAENPVKDGILYDTSEHTVTVTVADIDENGNEKAGKLTATVSKGEAGVFKNKRYTSSGNVSLEVNKALTGRDLTSDDLFTFVLKDSQGNVLQTKTNGSDGKVSFSEIRYTLDQIPYGETREFTYTVSEQIPDDAKNDSGTEYKNAADEEKAAGGFTKNGITYSNTPITIEVNATENRNGTITTSVSYDPTGATVTNEYQSSGSIELKAKKTLTGSALYNEQFSFVLSAPDGTPMPGGAASVTENGKEKKTITVSNAADGGVSFGNITYTQADISGSPYTYTIEEVIPEGSTDNGDGTYRKDNYTYSKQTQTVTVTLRDEDGVITPTAVYSNGSSEATFVNEYSAVGYLELSAKKTLTGKNLENNTFEFKVMDGETIVKGINDEELIAHNTGGAVTFKKIGYFYDDQTKEYYYVDSQGNKKGYALTLDKDNCITYQIYETVPLGAENASGKQYGEASAEEKAAGGFTKDGITYDSSPVIVKVKLEVAENGITATPLYSHNNVSGNNTFSNEYHSSGTVTLEAKKRLEGNKQLEAGQYSFTLSSTNGPLPKDVNGIETTTVFNTADGKALFGEIVFTQDDVAKSPIVYTITEVKPGETDENYQKGVAYDAHTETVKVILSDDGKGTITATPEYDTDGVLFINRYKTTPISDRLQAEKILRDKASNQNRSIPAGKFSFTLSLVSAKSGSGVDASDLNYQFDRRTVSNNASSGENNVAEVDFGEITFTEPGIYTFQVLETSSDGRGITVDKVSYSVVYSVTDKGDGTLELTRTVNGDTQGKAAFINIYEAKGTAIVKAKKTLTGAELKNNQFTFTLTPNHVEDAEGKTVEITDPNSEQTVKNKEDGEIVFASLNYTQAGVYFYTLKEISEGAGGITYDETEHTVKVTVKDPETGTLNTRVSYDNGTSTPPVFKNTYEADSVSVPLSAEKQLEGKALEGSDFTFSISLTRATDIEGKTISVSGTTKAQTNLTNDKDGNISMRPLTFSKAGTYVYAMKETSTNKEGVVVDTTEYVITIEVTDNGEGKLIAADPVIKKSNGEEVQMIVFVNNYSPDTTTAELKANKTIAGEGRELKAGEFTFEAKLISAKDSIGNDISDSVPDIEKTKTAQNAADGTVSFGINTYEKAGTYTYEIKETTQSSDEITSSTVTYKAIVQVIDNNKGSLSANVLYKDPSGNVVSLDNVVFENRYNSGSLKIEKVLQTYDAENDQEFTFTVSLKNKEDAPISGAYKAQKSGRAEPERIVFDANGEATVKLKGGETYTISNLPNGAKYQVVESSLTGYALVSESTSGDTGSISTNTIVTASFTNKDERKGDLRVIKEVIGNAADTSDAFSIQVKLYKNSNISDENIAQITGIYGAATFKDGVADLTIKGGNDAKLITGLPYGIYYVVSEKQEDAQTHITDNDYVHETSLDRNLNGFIKDKTGDNAITASLTNRKDTYGGFSVSKKVTGNASVKLRSYHFTVELSGEGSQQINGTYGQITFANGKAEFDLEANEKKVAAGLPNGIIYKITETDYSGDGYTTTRTNEEKGIVGKTASQNKADITENSIDDANKAVFVNNKNGQGDLSITKIAEGNLARPEDEFTFQICLIDVEESVGTSSYTCTIAGKDGSLVTGAINNLIFSNGVSSEFKLKDGQTITVAGIPNKTKYQITEKDAKGYISEIKVNGVVGTTGTIRDNAQNSVIVTNTKNGYGGLVLTKKTAGSDKDKRTWFAYKVTLTGDGAQDVTGVFGDVRFKNGVSTGPADTHGDPDYANGKVPAGYFKIQAGADSSSYQVPEKVVITGLPANLSYKVEEEDYKKIYDSQTASSNATGTIKAVMKNGQYVSASEITENLIEDTNKDIYFTNVRNRDGKLVIRKEAIGNLDGVSHQYSFTVKLLLNGVGVNGSYDGVVFTNGVSDPILLQAGQTREITGLPLGTVFTVTENTDLLSDGYETETYSLTSVDKNEENDSTTITTEAGKNSGIIAVGQREVLVTNVYHNVLSRLSVTKTVKGREWADKDKFTFRLSAVGGAPIPEDENGNQAIATKVAPTAVFGDISFTKAGTYEYIIREEKGDADLEYDTKQYHAKIIIKEEEPSRKLVVDSVKYEEEETLTITNAFNLQIGKADEDGKTRLDGAVFQILDEDGKQVSGEKWVSSANSLHKISAVLVPGKVYTLHEETAPEGYLKAEDTTFSVNEKGRITGSADIKVDENGVIVLLAKDKKTKISVSKVDITTKNKVPGAHIQIIDKDGKVVEEWNSTTTPHEVTGLKIGETYTLRESKAPDGYIVTEDTRFSLNEEGKVVTDEQDRPAKSDANDPNHLLVEDAKTIVKISKVDIGTGQELPGATIQIIDSKGHVVESWTSADKPHEVTGLNVGETYTLRETVAPEGYAITTDTTFILNEKGEVSGGTTTQKEGILLVEDAKLPQVSKVDATSQKELPGAHIQVLDSKGTVVDEWDSTDIPHPVKGVKVGETYTLHETIAPTGYAVAADTTFVIDKNGKAAGTAKLSSDGAILVEDLLKTGDGQIEVIKYTLKNDRSFKVVNQTFYTALFSDAAMTNRVSEVMPLVLANTYTASVKFTNLAYGTYYVGETDAAGTRITSASNIQAVEIEGGQVTLGNANKTGSAVIKNTVPEGVLGAYADINLKVQKKVVNSSGKALNVNDTFYFAVYSDQACTRRVRGVEIQSIRLNGSSGGSTSFRSLPYASAFFVAEVDKNGNKVASKNNYNYSVTVNGDNLSYREADGATVTVTNRSKAKTAPANREKQDENKNQNRPAVRTGDSTPILPMLVTMIVSGIAALYLVLRRRRRT